MKEYVIQEFGFRVKKIHDVSFLLVKTCLLRMNLSLKGLDPVGQH